jgi:uncharacterized membrane protein
MWIITFVLMWVLKEQFVPGVGGVIGLLLGFRLISEVDRLLGIAVMFIALYQLYFAAFKSEAKK